MPKRYVPENGLSTMPTSPATLRPERCLRRQRISPIGLAHGLITSRATHATAHASPRSQSGMTLIEVLISSLLVGMIAIGTFTAFDVTNRASADQRVHAQATQLAEQDQERLRSFSTTTLASLGEVEQYRAENGICLEKPSSSWLYWSKASTSFCEKVSAYEGKTYTGTVFTVTSSTQYVAAEKGTEKAQFTCERSGGTTDYLQTTSSVKWSALGSRPAVTQSSIVTDPNTTGTTVKVKNQKEEPVEGVTITLKTGSGAITLITGSGGCVTFGGLKAETDKVEASKTGWVNKSGKGPPWTKEVTVTSGSINSTEFIIAQPGAIEARFVLGNGTATKSDTFYAYQGNIEAPPDFVGGTNGPPYAEKATLSGLFPFTKAPKPFPPEPYTVYAGDCEKNNPKSVTGGIVTEKLVNVEPNITTPVKLEVPEVAVTIYETEKPSKVALTTVEPGSEMVNTECAGASAQNVTPVEYRHTVSITSAGVIEPHALQDAKKLELCVLAKLNTGKYYKDLKEIKNEKQSGTSL